MLNLHQQQQQHEKSVNIAMNFKQTHDDDSKPEGRGSVNFKSRSDKVADSVTNETNDEVKSNETSETISNRTHQKYLLNDLSNTGKHSDIISEFINREIKYSGIASSPVHLHGNLKLESKHGMPFFEFKVKCPEDVFVAKTWRIGNGFNFVYTFHSIDNNRKKSNATELESHDFDKDSSIVAKMLVSSNLCSEINDKVSDNSMVTEFVLYDLSHSRHSVSSEKKPLCEQNAVKTRKASRVEPKEETFGMVFEENMSKGYCSNIVEPTQGQMQHPQPPGYKKFTAVTHNSQ
ncbi:hypothetical protein KIW84_075113 [Lathyrus oleraceus]|uniref:Uncharacterized protein n=2 Tax=Pisum sativum TaxID=3888 RepID=A0A9D5A1H6_PEA|nr:hypothetical protein KIW84_075113 [Pisum sativum]